MYTVYILQDEKGSLYKGVTNNITRRLKEHRSGHTKTTRFMKNIVLLYSEEYDSFEQARSREKYFKTAAGRRYLKIHMRG